MPATDDVAGVYTPGRVLRVGDAEGQAESYELALTVVSAREFKRGVLVRFEGVGDRNAAEVLRGRTLLLSADEARPLDAGEYFLHDLVGMEVEVESGGVLGRVADIYEVAQGHCLGVSDGEREHLVPFTATLVRKVDLEAGRIVIEPLPGLFDL
jgi:16S rRNA processing protein RimM